ncbi:MAG: hypothetical protein ACRDWV_07335 [Acidimicrobiales bacterium]
MRLDLTAFVDESIRRGPTGFYLLAAVLVRYDALPAAREAARSVPLPGQRRFHWRSDSEAQRRRMLATVSSLDGVNRGYVFAPMGTCNPARARALCLNRLLWDLVEMGVDHLVIGSREAQNDDRDRRTIVQAKRANRASTELRYEFRRPHDEAALWLPDAAIAGAVAHERATGDASYLDLLGDVQVSVVVTDP